MSALFVIAGAAVYGFGFCSFLLPNGIFVGGASGAAATVARFVHVPVGVLIMLINLPLLAVCARRDGLSSVARTAAGAAAVSAGAQAGTLLPAFTGDLLLSSLAGGAIMGLGTGLMLVRGFTSGGSDLAGYLISRRFPRVSAGRAILVIDLAVILTSAAVTGEAATLAYSAVSSAAYSVAVDRVMRGQSDCRLAFIISDESAAVVGRIALELGRGVTVLSGRGGYTGSERTVLMCAVRRREEYALRRLVRETDPAAFVILASSVEAVGEGFAG